MDDYYEYRHVILPKETYKKMQRGRLLTESVSFLLSRNGEPWAYSNQEAGCTTSYTDQNPTSSSSGDPKEATLKPDFLPPASSHLQIPSVTEKLDHIMLCPSYLIYHHHLPLLRPFCDKTGITTSSLGDKIWS